MTDTGKILRLCSIGAVLGMYILCRSNYWNFFSVETLLVLNIGQNITFVIGR